MQRRMSNGLEVVMLGSNMQTNSKLAETSNSNNSLLNKQRHKFVFKNLRENKKNKSSMNDENLFLNLKNNQFLAASSATNELVINGKNFSVKNSEF